MCPDLTKTCEESRTDITDDTDDNVPTIALWKEAK